MKLRFINRNYLHHPYQSWCATRRVGWFSHTHYSSSFCDTMRCTKLKHFFIMKYNISLFHMCLKHNPKFKWIILLQNYDIYFKHFYLSILQAGNPTWDSPEKAPHTHTLIICSLSPVNLWWEGSLQNCLKFMHTWVCLTHMHSIWIQPNLSLHYGSIFFFKLAIKLIKTVGNWTNHLNYIAKIVYWHHTDQRK